MRWWLIVLVVALVGCGGGDPPDEGFLSDARVVFTEAWEYDDEFLLAEGRQVCDDLEAVTVRQLVAKTQRRAIDDDERYLRGGLIALGVKHFCPQHGEQVARMVNGQ